MHKHEHTHEHLKPSSHFGADRAAVYDAQAAVTIAGHAGMYELVAAALAVEVTNPDASLLFVGIGTGSEVLPVVKYGAPGWHFTGVDPSADMLAVAEKRMVTEGLGARARLHACELSALPLGAPFDGASMMGVLHHVQGTEARVALLREVARRLKPGAPLVIGCRVGAEATLLQVEARRLEHHGVPPERLEQLRKGIPLMQPPENDAALFALLNQAHLGAPRLLFAAAQFKVFLTRYAPTA